MSAQVTVAEAELALKTAHENAKQDRRKKDSDALSAALRELRAARKHKLKVDAAVELMINKRQALSQLIVQMLEMISNHAAVKPQHYDVLPGCDCEDCTVWRKTSKELQWSHANLLEEKKAGTGDPNANTALQRDLAVRLVTLERTVSNLENKLRDQPVGAQRLEGGLGAVR
jgi:hypothetical protein